MKIKSPPVINNSKLLWGTVNKIIGTERPRIPTEILIDGTAQYGVTLSKQFNMHFFTSGAFTDPKIAPVSKSAISYIPMACSDSLFLAPTSGEEIASTVYALKDTCSPGYDEISALPIKAVICYISGPLTYICKRMLVTGMFPDQMKVARVTVVFKGGSKN